jgi:PAS domain S-box-containing protein
MTRFPGQKFLTVLNLQGLAEYALELLVVGGVYFVLAKTFSAAIPVWPAAGFAVGACLLQGLRIWPAFLVASLFAGSSTDIGDVTLADSFPTLLAISIGNTLEAALAGYLTNIWANGCKAFSTPGRVAKFAIGVGPGVMLGAAIGVGSLCLAGYAAWSNFVALWATWWLRHAAGIFVIAPMVILWTDSDFRTFDRDKFLAALTAFLAATVAGLIAFSPLLDLGVNRIALSVLAVAPLLWAALQCRARDTATCTLILSGFAVWNAVAPGAVATFPNESFLMAIIFMISASVLGLILSADVAGRQRVEAKLRRQEQNLRTMFNQAVVGVGQIDLKGRWKLVNSRFCEIVARPLAELVQMSIHHLIDPDDLPRMLELLEHAIRTGEGFVIETRFVCPDSTRRWVRSHIAAMSDQSGAVHQLMIVAEDVTARRRAEEGLVNTISERTTTLKHTNEVLHAEIEQRKRVEEALKHDIAERRKAQDALVESEMRFRMVIQGITDYAIFMLDRDGCIANWNVGAERIHQYTAAEIVGQHFDRFFCEEERQRGEPARALQVAAYEGKYTVEGWRVRRDESQFWASVLIEAIRDEAGMLVGFVKITRDISERRQAQASLGRAQEQLAQSQKMEALGQLTGSIAHDFNNLLMIVSGHAQLLRRRLVDPKHLQAIDAVHTAATRGESLTRQLLAFSRRQPINPVVADIKERIEAVHEMLVGSLRGNVQLRCNIAPDIWSVEVDIAELELALVNIAVNARDAMPGGGIITLSATNVTLQKSDQVDQLEGDFVALAMTDTGVGIAADLLPKIFEPFFTTKALGKGTGLGLAQVYGFAHQSGGTVIATSTVGSGTAITIYLPRKDAVLVKSAEAPSPQLIASGQDAILVVEDNDEVAKVTASLVEQLGYQTSREANATDALNRLQRGDRFILVLSDVVMPGSMNGIALAQEIENRYPQIPVLLTSGYSDVMQTARSPFQILRKPFQLSALEKSIREALEHAAGRENRGRILQFSRVRATSQQQ